MKSSPYTDIFAFDPQIFVMWADKIVLGAPVFPFQRVLKSEN
jgi:hypothetical protein